MPLFLRIPLGLICYDCRLGRLLEYWSLSSVVMKGNSAPRRGGNKPAVQRRVRYSMQGTFFQCLALSLVHAYLPQNLL